DQVETSGWLVEPDLLKALGPRLRRVMPPADGKKAFGRAIDAVEPLRPARQVAAAGLRADSIVQLEREIGGTEQLRHRPGRSCRNGLDPSRPSGCPGDGARGPRGSVRRSCPVYVWWSAIRRGGIPAWRFPRARGRPADRRRSWPAPWRHQSSPDSRATSQMP